MKKQNKFQYIFEDMRMSILEGVFNYGDALPSEHQLVKKYKVSRETVRKSLNMLASDGMIQKIRGKGSVVIYHGMTEFPFNDLKSFKEIQNELALKHQTVVVLFEKITAGQAQDAKKALDLSQGRQLWHFIRYRQIGQATKIIDEDYILADLFPDLSEEIIQDSLYDYIEKDKGYEISFSSKSITFEPFGERERLAFGDVSPQYSATVTGIVHLKDTTKFQYNVSKHIATEFKFTDFSRRHTHV
ncbi:MULTISPECIES: trehalose operon repressor [Staphylococcus]|uniref:Trehalose operon repressor n=1 Tax=Staphylococcus schleiferi TaxID=1295 RepID=A0A7Z7VYW3_STASC|nr:MULTISPECIES: trehalose operon repressor [Staphylococcus]QGS46706.1 trehalose operon repressor [Mammaliicoccus fleurettii]EPD50158.1 trehalose operon repressor [Staphylococcus sp. HGB0015]MBF1994017.1 trehalose operon repressor [Staphylococcus schleiferi]MBF2039626.1 trehalose operon repressor [Staphylococcus schleiferi]MBF2101579.1 trehalose operon repressor [Staphylococcus schleiferi]